LKVGLRRPEVTKCEWLDGDGAATGKGLAGQALKLSASFNADAEEGADAAFRVYREGADPKRDKPEHEAGGKIKDGKAGAEWTYRYKHDPENPLKEKPKYFFTVNSRRCKEADSGDVEIRMDYYVHLRTSDGEVLVDKDCTTEFSDGTTEDGRTDVDGDMEFKDKVPGITLWADYKTEDDETVRIDLYKSGDTYD
jgi:hypothetical protein